MPHHFQPENFLKNLEGKIVEVKIKEYGNLRGKFICIDQKMNLGLSNVKDLSTNESYKLCFLRGSTITYMSLIESL